MWTLEKQTAHLNTNHITAVLDVLQPSQGLSNLAAFRCPLTNCRVLQILAPFRRDGSESLHEVYVRGDDLIASYAGSESTALQPHIRWRSLQIRTQQLDAVGVELIVSMQTYLLDSDPTVSISSTLVATDVRRCVDLENGDFETLAVISPGELPVSEDPRASLIVFRLVGVDISYVEMVPPTDYRGGQLQGTSPGSSAVCWRSRIFSERLEKGVIRRGRIWGLFVRRSHDLELAVRCYRQLTSSPPPLTA